MLHGLIDQRHLNGTIVTMLREDPTQSAGQSSDSRLLQLPDGSRIRLRPRNFSLVPRAAAAPPPIDSFGLREDEFVNADSVAKLQTQSLIKNKLTSSTRTSEESAADDVCVKALQSCIAAHAQFPLDEGTTADLIDAVARASSWAIIEASVPSYLAAAFALPQQVLQTLMDFIMAAAQPALAGVLKGWGRSPNEMPVIPLACIKAAAVSFKLWATNRPAWPYAATGEIQAAADLFCSSTRALLPLLSFDADDVAFASRAVCFYMTVVCEEAAAFTEHLRQQQQHESFSALSPPHVDAWRSDPLHAALAFVAHALSLLSPSPKSFATLRLPHPDCFCLPLSPNNPILGARGAIQGFKDCRWEQALWRLMLTCLRAVDVHGLHRLHHKLCSDRALILTRCLSRTMRGLQSASSSFTDAPFRLAAIHPLLLLCVRASWGEHYKVVTACCDMACEVLTHASSLVPSLAHAHVVQLLQVFVALAGAEPEEKDLHRAVEVSLNAASRLLHASTDSIWYQPSSSSECEVSCEPQLAVYKRDVQRQLASMSASLAQSSGQTPLSYASSSCSHHGHALRLAALTCLRVILLRHTSTSPDNAMCLRAAYRLIVCCCCCATVLTRLQWRQRRRQWHHHQQ